MRKTKVALVCDWLTDVGGAEQVIYAIHQIFPDAPIYTSQYRPKNIKPYSFPDVRVGYLNLFPLCFRKIIVPIRQRYFKNLDLDEYDLVISITGGDAKLITTTGKHVCFCHVPTQYYWDKSDIYLKNPGFGIFNIIVRPIFRLLLPYLRATDLDGAKNPNGFITISKYAKNSIKKYYKRESTVIYPPVNIKTFTQAVENYKIKIVKCQTENNHNKNIKNKKSQIKQNNNKIIKNKLSQVLESEQDFYLNFSRQTNWKNLDLIVKTCLKLKKTLVLVGRGPEHKRLKKIANNSPFIIFLDFLPAEDLAKLLTKAKAFIFPSEEPFGIAPVESLAAGCPVIALKKGGALDYLIDGKNGIFFSRATVPSLEKAIKKFELLKRKHPKKYIFSRKRVSKTALPFSSDIFQQNLKAYLSNLLPYLNI